MTTIDLIDSFCRQSIIGIDPIDVFLTIGAQLCTHPWVGGSPCLVNSVARKLNGGGSWVGELVGGADIMKG